MLAYVWVYKWVNSHVLAYVSASSSLFHHPSASSKCNAKGTCLGAKKSSSIRQPHSQLGSAWVNHDGELDSINFCLKCGAGELCQILEPLMLFTPEIHWCKNFKHFTHAYTHKCWTHLAIACMVLLSHIHTREEPLIYLQLAGRWPIKRLIAV